MFTERIPCKDSAFSIDNNITFKELLHNTSYNGVTLNAPINIDLLICCFSETSSDYGWCIVFIILTYTKDDDFFLKVMHKRIYFLHFTKKRCIFAYNYLEKYSFFVS